MKRWSKDEVEFLLKNYNKISAKEIAIQLGRTENAIRSKVSKEKRQVSRKNGYLTETQRKRKIKNILLLATGILLEDKKV